MALRSFRQILANCSEEAKRASALSLFKSEILEDCTIFFHLAFAQESELLCELCLLWLTVLSVKDADLSQTLLETVDVVPEFTRLVEHRDPRVVLNSISVLANVLGQIPQYKEVLLDAGVISTVGKYFEELRGQNTPWEAELFAPCSLFLACQLTSPPVKMGQKAILDKLHWFVLCLSKQARTEGRCETESLACVDALVDALKKRYLWEFMQLPSALDLVQSLFLLLKSPKCENKRLAVSVLENLCWRPMEFMEPVFSRPDTQRILLALMDAPDTREPILGLFGSLFESSMIVDSIFQNKMEDIASKMLEILQSSLGKNNRRELALSLEMAFNMLSNGKSFELGRFMLANRGYVLE